jgi:hypothetical protein
MDDAAINALRDSKNKVLPADVNIVKLFIQFIRYRHLLGTPIESNEDVVSITKYEFDQFRINGVFHYQELVAKAAAASAPPRPTTMVSNQSINPFQRGIKRDQSASPDVQDDEDDDTSQAHVQDVAKVVDDDFVLNTANELELFETQKTYVSPVLEATVSTDSERAIVPEQAGDRDAQRVHDISYSVAPVVRQGDGASPGDGTAS